MEYTITLPNDHPRTTIRELLEQEWLVPRKVRHLLRTRKNVRVNGETALFHQEGSAHASSRRSRLHVSASDFWEQREDYGVV